MTATVLLDHDATHDQWLDARTQGVGGSDVGTILGSNPWNTPLDIWATKTGQAPLVAETPAMKVGHALEAGVLLEVGILLLFLGVQFITMGLLAELIIRTYHESQEKPIYVIKSIIGAPPED